MSESMKLEQIIEKLRETRKDKKLSFRKAAVKVGYTAEWLVLVETHRKQPSLDFLANYAESLGYELRFVLEEKECE